MNSGGMERYTLDLINGFVKKGIKVVIFTKKADFNLPESQMGKVIVIPCKFIPQKLRDRYFSWRVRNLRNIYPVDIMIGCCRSEPTDIYICGGTHPGFLRETKKTLSYGDRLTNAFEKRVYENTRAVIAHSELVKKEVEEFYPFCRNKQTLLYPPVNLEKFKIRTKNLAKDIRKEYGLPKDRLLYLFVSSSHKRKGFTLLKEFFEETKLPVSLLVCGRPLPKENYKNIYYLGYEKNLEDIYLQCDFSILASTYEPFGLVGIESLAMNTPLVISDKLGCTEVIWNDVMVKFDPRCTASLSAAIEYSIQHAELMKKKASQGLNVKFKCSLELDDHVSDLINICRKLCQNKESFG